MTKLGLVVLAAASAVYAGPTAAVDVSLPLTDDAYVNFQFPAKNYGGWSYMWAHRGGLRHSLVRFDASSVAGRGIASATLSLFLRNINAPARIEIRALHPTATWAERAVTFDSRPAVQEEVIAALEVTTANELSVLSFDVTRAVREWARGFAPATSLEIVAVGSAHLVLDTKERSGGTPPALRVVTAEAPAPDGSTPRVLDLSAVPLLIDEPGRYVLDKDWDIGSNAEPHGVIDVEADDVEIDLRGFTIRWTSGGSGSSGITITGDDVTVKNGSLLADEFASAVTSEAARTVVDSIVVRSAGIRLFGPNAIMRNSWHRGRGLVEIAAPNGRFERNRLQCNRVCLLVTGTGAEIRQNKLANGQADVVVLQGDGILFENNILHANLIDLQVLTIDGNHNRISGNTFRTPDQSDLPVAIRVDGTGNVLRDNVAMPSPAGDLWGVGIWFTQDGNSFGNNEIAAAVPFELGNTVQADLGGNVRF